MNVSDALRNRISVRAFDPDRPVSQRQIEDILDAARFAPSGGNLQPWRIIVVSGEERARVIALAQARLAADPAGEEGDDPIYPPDLWEPYRGRRAKVGEDMYALLGISREDRAGRLGHLARNYQFFDAPVGLFFVIDRRMGRGQWAHMGMLMQSIALVAVERGLATCMQEAWARLRASLGRHFELAETEMITCGMALGYALDAPVNTLRSEREPVSNFANFRGFSA